jgi:uracil-DNA glycosylase
MQINLPLGKLFYRMKSKPYFQELMESVDEEYKNHTCYPPKELILMR